MQLHAIDNNYQVISARRAAKHTNYKCTECQEIVRLRSGPHRQAHFYHLEPTPFCRQHQKGAIHLQLQSYFFNQLPPGDCLLEHPFKEIGRIADVAWLSQKIVFEIQYSPISAEEVLGRNLDYQKLGWQVIWILHEHQYNQVRVSAAELALRSSPYYYSNMDSQGSGIIYDQFDIWERGVRKGRLSPLPIDIQREIKFAPFENSLPLKVLEERRKNWPISFPGDLMHLSSESKYFKLALDREKSFNSTSKIKLWKKIWNYSPYQIFFRFILERMCR